MLLAHAGPWILWPLIPLFWFSVIFLLFFLVMRRRRHFWYSGRSGESVLAERFARGEIDETEFRSRRDVLREGGRR